MKNPYKSYKMKLTTLSPVFIGGGEELNQGQYIFNNTTMTAKILDENISDILTYFKKFSKNVKR